MTSRWALFAFVAPLSLLLASGCGYSTKRPFRTDLRTIHVEMAHSRDFRRELEMRLTEALVKRIIMDTPYRLASAQRADALLSTEIIKVDNRSLGDDFDTDLPREIGTTMVVRYRLKDMRTGEILAERERTVHHAGYIPAVGETFSDAVTRVVDGLAEQIVESMETDW